MIYIIFLLEKCHDLEEIEKVFFEEIAKDTQFLTIVGIE